MVGRAGNGCQRWSNPARRLSVALEARLALEPDPTGWAPGVTQVVQSIGGMHTGLPVYQCAGARLVLGAGLR
jgi:hypothetical protein